MELSFTELQSAQELDSTSTGLDASLLDTNWQTTAAVGLTIASGGVGGAIMLAAFPAQTLAAGAAIGGLAYAGKRRADGLSALPEFLTFKKDESESTDAVTTPQTETAPAAA